MLQQRTKTNRDVGEPEVLEQVHQVQEEPPVLEPHQRVEGVKRDLPKLEGGELGEEVPPRLTPSPSLFFNSCPTFHGS